MSECTNPTTAVRLLMIPSIFVAVFAANQSGHSHAAKVPVPVTAPVMMSTTASPATQQKLEKLAAAQLEAQLNIHNQARPGTLSCWTTRPG